MSEHTEDKTTMDEVDLETAWASVNNRSKADAIGWIEAARHALECMLANGIEGYWCRRALSTLFVARKEIEKIRVEVRREGMDEGDS